jgi:hypothetical protein
LNTLNSALRVSAAPAPVCDDLRLAEARSASHLATPCRSVHRADIGGTSAAGDALTRLAVVLLSGINALMWEVYAESRVMGAVGATIAIGFAIWIKRDAARR